MAFEKGNKVGVQFTSDNQPQKRGRKPSLYKKLRAITKTKVGYELGKDDYFEIIRWVMESNTAQLEALVKDPDNPKMANKETPLWLLNVITAIKSDIRYGRTSTVEMIFDRIFGKATQVVESEVNAQVNTSVDLSALSTEELLQYNTLLEKIKGDGKK